MDIFTKNFVKEFKAVTKSLKDQSIMSFNVAQLGIQKDALLSLTKSFVRIQGITGDSVFEELNDVVGFIYEGKELSERGGYAFSNVEKSLSVKSSSLVVAVSKAVKVPNRYVSPVGGLGYLGYDYVEVDDLEKPFLLFEVDKSFLYPEDTFVLTLGINKPREYFHLTTLMLTNGIKLFISIQNRSKIRNTENKNMFKIGESLELMKSCVNQLVDMLTYQGLAFDREFFEYIDGEGIVSNLVIENFDGNDMVEESLVDISIKEREKRKFELGVR